MLELEYQILEYVEPPSAMSYYGTNHHMLKQ